MIWPFYLATGLGTGFLIGYEGFPPAIAFVGVVALYGLAEVTADD